MEDLGGRVDCKPEEVLLRQLAQTAVIVRVWRCSRLHRHSMDTTVSKLAGRRISSVRFQDTHCLRCESAVGHSSLAHGAHVVPMDVPEDWSTEGFVKGLAPHIAMLYATLLKGNTKRSQHQPR